MNGYECEHTKALHTSSEGDVLAKHCSKMAEFELRTTDQTIRSCRSHVGTFAIRFDRCVVERVNA